MVDVLDPIRFKELCWPDVVFYDKQVETIYSVRDDDETVVPAGNMLGKDFVAAFIVIWFFLSRTPCKIVTTSVKDKHLDVLWSEVDKWVQSSKYPLLMNQGGPLDINNNGMRRVVGSQVRKDSYVMRLVASDLTVESFQGHHVTPVSGTLEATDNLPRNLFVGDEASGLPDKYWTMAKTWAKRALIFGNTWPCNNFFKTAIKGDKATTDKGGDRPRPDGMGYYRRVIQIRGEDSPNVKLGLAEVRAGKKPSHRMLIPGVLSYREYLKRRATWDKPQQCVSLDAEFYDGPEIKMYPATWLDLAEQLAERLLGKPRKAKTMGVDSGEGSADTCWSICDDLGLILLRSMKTPDTSVIPDITIQFIKEYGLDPKNVLFDRGGGGKEHADQLRRVGYNVRTVAFGETVAPEMKNRGVVSTLPTRKEQAEERYVYKNRRAQMYGILRQELNPALGEGFALPAEYTELRRQLEPIPLLQDGEGRTYLPPKHKKSKDSAELTMVELIGCSPDEADSLVLAVFGLKVKSSTFIVKSMV